MYAEYFFKCSKKAPTLKKKTQTSKQAKKKYINPLQKKKNTDSHIVNNPLIAAIYIN